MKMHNVSLKKPQTIVQVINNQIFRVLGEANKAINDYKYRLQKAEQEIASLQASFARSETQVIRYKSTAEAAEKAEADLKIERRKLQREVSHAWRSQRIPEYFTNFLSIQSIPQPIMIELWDECHCQ